MKQLLSFGSVLSALVGGSALHPYVAGQVGGSSDVLLGQGLLELAAISILLAVMFGLARLMLSGWRPSLPSRRQFGNFVPSPYSFAVTFLALMLVFAAAGAGVFGPGAQQVHDDLDPTQEADALACGGVCVAAGVGIAVGMAAGYVTNEYLNGDDTDSTYTKAEAAETEQEVYTHAQTIYNDSRTTDAIMGNQVEDGSRTVAWTKGKIAAIEAMNNGSTEQEAINASKKAVEDYYSTMFVNLANQQTDTYRKMEYLADVYGGHQNLSRLDGVAVEDAQGNHHSFYTNETVVELPNGTHHDVALGKVVIQGQFYQDSTNTKNGDTIAFSPYLYSYVPNRSEFADNYGGVKDGEYMNLTVANPNGPDMNFEAYNGNSSNYMDPADVGFRDRFRQIRNANDQMKSNLELWVQNYYPEYTAGEINSTELVDPAMLSQEMATEYNSTGYYAYAAADLAVQGTNGSLNHSMVVEVARPGTNATYNGTVFTDWKPSSTNGSLVAGTWYDPASTSKPVYVATNDGLQLVNDSFVIHEMTNVKTGEQVNETDLRTYNRQTSNVSLTADQLQQLIEVREELDETQAAAAGESSTDPLLLVGAAAVALALIAARGKEGSR